MPDHISLPELPRVLSARYGLTASHNALWRAACDGRIPATRRGSRWLIDPADLPAIAAALLART
jgi:hypothetical protein